MSLRDQIATAEGKRIYVRRLFATIADRYDFITVALSYGRDRKWKRRLIDLAAPAKTTRALDLATGTGDIAYGLAARGAHVVALDITPRMIELARAKAIQHEPVRFLVGDMLALPFPAGSFDLVTVGYGLRNVPDLGVAIDELARVLQPGGQLMSLEFNRPPNALVRWLYFHYLNVAGSLFGWLLHRDPDTYRYIPASLRTYPDADGVAQMMAARGFARVEHVPVFGGLMSIHRGFKR
ncbi:MAG: dimethylmenaquinone methyltransferase [Blastocatellia bacterium]|nr:MAG: dimethylmenaquinone methyltransferase [Blastocatellia bacterium]